MFVIEEGLVQGLRQIGDQGRNAQPLADLQNLVPTERRLRKPPVVEYPFTSPTQSTVWPHPRIIRDGRNVLLAHQGTIRHINESTLAVETTANATLTLSHRVNAPNTTDISLTGESAWLFLRGRIYGEFFYVPCAENDNIRVYRLDGTYVTSWGSTGSGNGQFNYPSCVAIYNDEVYVADSQNARIQVFDLDGNFKRKWGSSGSGAGQFLLNPLYVTVNEFGVYVQEATNKRVNRFEHDGTYDTRIVADNDGQRVIFGNTLYALVQTGSGPDTYAISTIDHELAGDTETAITLPVVGTWDEGNFDLNEEFYISTYTVSGTTTVYMIPRANPAGLVSVSITGSSLITVQMSRNTVITIELGTSDMKVFSINPVSWQLAGFTNNVWLATNSRNLLYRLPSNASTAADEETTVRVNAIANHRGRLCLGGVGGTIPSVWTDVYYEIWRRSYNGDMVLGDDLDFDTSFVLVSQPGGEADDTPFVNILSCFEILGSTIRGAVDSVIRQDLEDGNIMVHRMSHRGGIRAMKSLGEDLMVYTSTGVSRLEFTERGIIERQLLNTGIVSRTGVDGDDREHVFLTQSGDLYRMRLGEGLEQLHYSEYLGGLDRGAVVVSFDPTERYYTISDGLKCYWLTRTGLGNCQAQMVLSMARLEGYRGIAGTWRTPDGQTAARIVTDIFDGGDKGVVEVELVKIATTDTSTGWKVKAWFRLEKSGAWITEGWVDFDDRGIARVKASGIDFYLELEADDYTLVDMNRIEVVMRAAGKRSLRTILTAAGA